MKTKTVGQMLREEREKYRLSLVEVSQKTRIRHEYLEALEENRFQDLPASTFVKGYIKSYSRLFNLDSQPLLALLRRDYKESAKGELVPREFLAPVIRTRVTWSPVTLLAGLVAIAFATLLIYVGVQWYNLNRPPDLKITAPQDQALVSARVEVIGRTHPEANVMVNLQPVSLKPDGSFETEIFMPRAGVATITVEASDRRGKSTLEQRTVLVEF
jgi:cytoskeleton protein RodZ